MYTDEFPPPTRKVGRSYYSMFVGFPIACFVLTFLTDIAYWMTDSYLWETISVWLLTVGMFGVAFAVIAGIVDLVRSRTIRGLEQSWPRVLGHVVAAVLAFVDVLVHSRDGYTAVVPEGLILSTLIVLILLGTSLSGRVATRRNAIGGMA